jgi:ABC-type multidrug transport system fused ATPase/permease subunit
MTKVVQPRYLHQYSSLHQPDRPKSPVYDSDSDSEKETKDTNERKQDPEIEGNSDATKKTKQTTKHRSRTTKNETKKKLANNLYLTQKEIKNGRMRLFGLVFAIIFLVVLVLILVGSSTKPDADGKSTENQSSQEKKDSLLLVFIVLGIILVISLIFAVIYYLIKHKKGSNKIQELKEDFQKEFGEIKNQLQEVKENTEVIDLPEPPSNNV